MKFSLISLLCLAVSCGQALETVSFRDVFQGHQQLANFEIALSDSFAAQLNVASAAASDGLVVFSLAVRRYFYALIFPNGTDKGDDQAATPFKYPIHSLTDPSIISQYPVQTTLPPYALNDFVRQHAELGWLYSYNSQLAFITSSGRFCVVRENNQLKAVSPSSSQALSSKCNYYLDKYGVKETSPLEGMLIDNYIRAPGWTGNRKHFDLTVRLEEFGQIATSITMFREFAMTGDGSVEERTKIDMYGYSGGQLRSKDQFFGDAVRLVKIRNPKNDATLSTNISIFKRDLWNRDATQYRGMVEELEKISNKPELSQQALELRQLMGQLGQPTISYNAKVYTLCGTSSAWVIHWYPIYYFPKYCLQATTKAPSQP